MLESGERGSMNNDDQLIAELGYQPVFKREFGLLATFSFAFSISGLIATNMVTLNYPLYAGGPPAVVWGWFIGCIGAMSIACSVAELVSAYPTCGGLYFCVKYLVPQPYMPVVAWIAGWMNLLGQACGCASTDFGCAQLILAAVAVNTNFEYVPTGSTSTQAFHPYPSIY